MRDSVVLQLVVVIVLLAVCATVPAAEEATKACCAKSGPLHLKVDFTVSSGQDNPKPVAGTTRMCPTTIGAGRTMPMNSTTMQ